MNNLFGKHFASMYTGSMRGKGALYFAVWGYVISHFVPDMKVGCQVELNADIIAFLIGGVSVKEVEEVILEMCEPDEKSRTDEQDGRKLVKVGPFDYQVVNGAKYRAIRDEEKRRDQNRESQRRHRNKQKEGNEQKSTIGEWSEQEKADNQEQVLKHYPKEGKPVFKKVGAPQEP